MVIRKSFTIDFYPSQELQVYETPTGEFILRIGTEIVKFDNKDQLGVFIEVLIDLEDNGR